MKSNTDFMGPMLNNVLLNVIEHMKKWGGQLDIRPPNLKIGGDTSPPSHPGLTPLLLTTGRIEIGL